MIRERLSASLEAHEGMKLRPYLDSEGFWTIGIGHKIHFDRMGVWEVEKLFTNGITEQKARDNLVNHITRAEQGARAVVGREYWEKLSDVRQEVLAEMVFQMGATGLHKFSKTLAFVRAEMHADAAVEMLNSKWAGQTPKRAATLSTRYSTGKYTS